jgi:hypothetical protein
VLGKAKDINYIGQDLCNGEMRINTRHCRQLIADIREKLRISISNR